MLELNPRTEFAGLQAGPTKGQPRRLLIALALLLVALVAVVVKDREFWLGSDEAVESYATYSENVSKTASAVRPAKLGQAPAAGTTTAKNSSAPKASGKPAVVASSLKDVSSSDSPVGESNRAVLPPLDVEVVAGDTHRTIHPGSNIAKVEIRGDSNRASATTMSMASLPTNAAEHGRLSSESVPEQQQTVDSSYPLLGQHTRVQGSVVLQAVVGIDGTIEDLRVLSGPAILSAAAQQAVRQWHFKPYLQHGQPVETKARITVNFSIRVSDNSAAS